MNRFILSIVILALFSCKKQSKESKNNVDQQAEQPVAVMALKKNDSISIDSELSRRLSNKEIATMFTRRKQNLLGISNTIYQAYSYKDKSGEYYLLLTDHMKEINEEKDTLYDNIYALNITNKNNQFKKVSTVKDEIDKDWETSIGFWNKYSELSDIDEDGLVDLILVYGTKGQDEYADGKVKIRIYHNQKRISIKHQNSGSSDGRLTKINSKFYALPIQIQQSVIGKMKLMTANKHATFSGDWENEMANKATRLEEK